MTNAIIYHGKPGDEEYNNPDLMPPTNFHWIPWIQKQLILNGIKADTPLAPQANNPQYDLWKTEFERFEPNADTIAIGHSCGGGFLVRWLSENKAVKLKKVILVAPWIDPEKMLDTGMFDFEINPDIGTRTELVVISSDNDHEQINTTVGAIQKAVEKVRLIEIPGKGHFVKESMGSRKFPELLKEALA